MQQLGGLGFRDRTRVSAKVLGRAVGESFSNPQGSFSNTGIHSAGRDSNVTTFLVSSNVKASFRLKLGGTRV